MQTSHGAHSLRNHDREEAILHETRLNRTGAFLLKLKHFSSYEILLKSPTYKARQELLYLWVKLQRRPAQLLLRSCPRETLNASEERTRAPADTEAAPAPRPPQRLSSQTGVREPGSLLRGPGPGRRHPKGPYLALGHAYEVTALVGGDCLCQRGRVGQACHTQEQGRVKSQCPPLCRPPPPAD